MTSIDSSGATRERSRVALVTCGALPDLDPDDRLLVSPLRQLGIHAEPAVWDDPAIDWARFDLVVLRSCWDYPARRDEFLAWARAVPRLANPADVVAWNTDKRYLAELASAGVPVVPTRWLSGSGHWTPPAGDVVVKPAVGAGGVDAGRYTPAQRDLAIAHAERLVSAGRLVMVQPYLPAVESAGETAVLFLAGECSHAVRKGPLLPGPDDGVPGLYRPEDIRAREASPAELAVARAALAVAPPGLLYARVDLIPGPDGAPLVVELELTEPSLYLAHGEGAADRFAIAIASRIVGARPARR